MRESLGGGGVRPKGGGFAIHPTYLTNTRTLRTLCLPPSNSTLIRITASSSSATPTPRVPEALDFHPNPTCHESITSVGPVAQTRIHCVATRSHHAGPEP